MRSIHGRYTCNQPSTKQQRHKVEPTACFGRNMLVLRRLCDLPTDSKAPLSLIAGSYMARTPPVEVLHMIWFVWGCQSTRATLASGAAFTSGTGDTINEGRGFGRVNVPQ